MKTPSKTPALHIGGVCDPDGKDLATVRLWVIPDHYNRSASRWKKAEERKFIVLTRTEFVERLQAMRKSGFKVNHKASILSNLIYFRIRQEFEADQPKRRKGRKAVAA